MPLPLNSSVIDDILGPTPTTLPRPKPRPSTSKPSQLASTTTSQPHAQRQQPGGASASSHRHADLSIGSTRDDPIILSPDLSPVPLPPEEPTSLSRAADDSGVSLPDRVNVSKTSRSPEGDARPSNTSLNASSSTDLPTTRETLAGQSFTDANATATSQGQLRESDSGSGAKVAARSTGEATLCLAQTFPRPPRPLQDPTSGSGGDDYHDGRAPQLPSADRELGCSTSSIAARLVQPQDPHGTVDPFPSSSSSFIPASTQPSQTSRSSTHYETRLPSSATPTFHAQPYPARRRDTGAGEGRLHSKTTASQLADTLSAADEGGQHYPPTRPPTATQLSGALLTDTAMGDISAAAPALPSTRSSPLSSASTSDYEDETTAVATTPAGVPLWTASEDTALLSTIQQKGTQWKAVENYFNKVSRGTYRSIRALRHRWNHLREGKSTPQLTAAKRAAKATPRARQDNGWTESENQVLLQGRAEGKVFAAIYADFKRKFRRSRRTRAAVCSRYHRLSQAGHHDGQEDEGEGEEEGEGEDSDDDLQDEERDADASEDVEMADLPSTSEPGMTRAGHYMWTDKDDEVLLASVARYRKETIDWPRVEKRYNRHCALPRSKQALQTRWHNIKKREPGSRQQQQGGARQPPASNGRGERGGGASPTSRPLAGHQHPPMASQIQDSQASLVGSLEHSSISVLRPTAAQQQHFALSGPRNSSFPLTSAAAPQQPPAPSSLLDTLSLSVDYEPNGVRISNVIPGLEVKVFSRKSVQLSLPDPSSSSFTTSPSSSFEEQPAFHLKVLHDGSVQAVRSPPGASLGAGLVRKDDGGVGTVARCVGVDGFSVSLVS